MGFDWLTESCTSTAIIKQLKAVIVNFGFKGRSAICEIFWPQLRLKDEDLLRHGTHYVSQALKGFMASRYIADISAQSLICLLAIASFFNNK